MIKVLDKSVSDKIAAGEVIERPISVIKELVENSVDAGAKSITVEIKNGGKTYMRITDDGCGIPGEEVETAFLRHATSKIEKAGDLGSISTLGFRGEALASIAAVTRTTMITKTRDEKTGRRVVIYGGQTVENAPTGCPDGTTIVVTDLFYNTPARREFLKSDGTESSLIIGFVSEMALAFDQIKFQMINNGRIIFTSTGNGDLKSAIMNVYQRREYDNLIPIESENEYCKVRGYISRPSLTRPSRREQFFFVNGRVVMSKVIETGITKGYRERHFEGRFPVAFIMVTVDPADIDVNIHPNKREVRFHYEQGITDGVEDAVRTALHEDEAVINFTDYYENHDSSNKEADDKSEKSLDTIRRILSTKRDAATSASAKKPRSKKSFQESFDIKPHSADVSLDTDSDLAEEKANYNTFNQNNITVNQSEINAAADRSENADVNSPENQADTSAFDLEPAERPFDFSHLEITGIIFNTYITAVDGDNFYMFDQHAAHERVLYEKLVGAYMLGAKASQPLLTPVSLDVPFSDTEEIDELIEPLDKMGFSIEPFGPNTLIMREIPTYMTITEAEDFAKDYMASAPENRGWNQVVVDKLITKSCKGAVKAHDVLSQAEAEALMDQLRLCRNPFSCPHGRPTFIRFSKYRIETFFKRIQ